MSANLLVLLAAVPSFLIALAAVPWVRRRAPDWGLMARPRAERFHKQPTPTGGGIAIWLGVVGTFAAGQVLLWLISSGAVRLEIFPQLLATHFAGLVAQSPRLWTLLAAATVMAILGVDRRSRRARLAGAAGRADVRGRGDGLARLAAVVVPRRAGGDGRALGRVDRRHRQFVQHARQRGRPFRRRGVPRGGDPGGRDAHGARSGVERPAVVRGRVSLGAGRCAGRVLVVQPAAGDDFHGRRGQLLRRLFASPRPR